RPDAALHPARLTVAKDRKNQQISVTTSLQQRLPAMSYPLYQVDAFADAVFTGNPAAVMPLDSWLSDDLLQAIAAENNLSETAFFVPARNGEADFDLRWFTPAVEIDLCGHATLASAHVLFEDLGFRGDRIRFSSRSGILT